MQESLMDHARIARYEARLRAEERSQATIQKYMRDVRAFAAWLGAEAVSREAVVRWKAHLMARGKAPVTINAALAALHGFFAMIGRSDIKVRYLKVQRKLFRETARELSRDEFQRLVEAARSRGNARLLLLLETICATGVRVSEARYITVEAARRGRADIAMKGKIRTILIPGKLTRKLMKYAQKQKIASGEIFITASGKGMSRRQIWGEMKRLGKAAGVEPGKVFPHNLRHLFARSYYAQTRDIVQLADVLGHSSLATTRIYLVTTGAEHRRQLEKLGFVS